MACKSGIKESLIGDSEQYRELVESASVAIGVLSKDRIVFINNAGAKLFGAAIPEQLTGKPLADFIHHAHREPVRKKLQNIEKNRVRFSAFEIKIVRVDKTTVDVEMSAAYFTCQRSPAVQFTFYEISRRKTAVKKLRQSENKHKGLTREFNVLLDGIRDNLILLSPELKIMWANKSANHLFGRDVSRLAGQYCYSLCCKTISPCENCPAARSFLSGKEETAEISTSEGKIWDLRAFPIKDDSGKVKSVIELAKDVTEKVNLQAGVTRTRHLASLGELAAGVAHEINNPINNIINYAQILVDEFNTENRDDDVARRIIKDGERIATIVRSLLSFARIRKEEKSLVYLHEIFSDMLSLTSAQIRKDGINLKVNIPSKFLKIPVHPQQIQQVFLNIISNSRFALNEKYPGTYENKILEITCEEIAFDNFPYVRIIFHDRGTGIPSHIIDKVINPFFSTKPNRIGTGLGLSISHGIITEHGGKLVINSVEGEFTKIIIDLPTETDGRT